MASDELKRKQRDVVYPTGNTPPPGDYTAPKLNANYHILKSAVMQPRVNIRKVHEKSFRMRYYELFWTNFDPYDDQFN